MRRHQESLIVNVDVGNNNVNDVNVANYKFVKVLSLWRNITNRNNNAQVKKSMKMVEEASNCKSCIKVGFKDGIIFLKKRSRWVLETNTEEILLNLSCASCTLFFSIKICSEDNDSVLEEELLIFQIIDNIPNTHRWRGRWRMAKCWKKNSPPVDSRRTPPFKYDQMKIYKSLSSLLCWNELLGFRKMKDADRVTRCHVTGVTP